MIEANLVHGAKLCAVEKLLFLGSSCIYPRVAPQPILESELLNGPLEPTNQWYPIAKIAGVKMCQAYRRQCGCDFSSAMPTNLYGPNDNFDPVTRLISSRRTRRNASGALRLSSGAPVRRAGSSCMSTIWLMRSFTC